MKMKCISVLLICVFIATACFSIKIKAEDELELGPNLHSMEYIFTIGEKKMQILVDENQMVEKNMGVSPYIKKERTMLPIRWIAESLNMELEYDELSRDIIIKKESQTIIINIDSKKAQKGKEVFDFKEEMENVNDRIFLPLTKIASLFDVEAGLVGEEKPIRWDGENKKVYILLDK